MKEFFYTRTADRQRNIFFVKINLINEHVLFNSVSPPIGS